MRSTEHDYKSMGEILPHNNQLDDEAINMLINMIGMESPNQKPLDIINDAIYYYGGTVASALVGKAYNQYLSNN